MKYLFRHKFISLLTFFSAIFIAMSLYNESQATQLNADIPNGTEQKEQSRIVPVGEDPGPVYTQMVRQWVEVTRFAKNAAEVATGKLKLDMQRDPRLQKIVTPEFTADLEQFFYELFISPETIKQLAQLYAQYFTLDEMQELINFYKTPLGQKLIKSNSEIMIKSQQIGLNLLRRHEREYMEVLKKYLGQVQLKSTTTLPEQPKATTPTTTPKSSTPSTTAEPKPATPPPMPEPKAPAPGASKGVPKPDTVDVPKPTAPITAPEVPMPELPGLPQ